MIETVFIFGSFGCHGGPKQWRQTGGTDVFNETSVTLRQWHFIEADQAAHDFQVIRQWNLSLVQARRSRCLRPGSSPRTQPLNC
jgi:hypothetical protein